MADGPIRTRALLTLVSCRKSRTGFH